MSLDFIAQKIHQATNEVKYNGSITLFQLGNRGLNPF